MSLDNRRIILLCVVSLRQFNFRAVNQESSPTLKSDSLTHPPPLIRKSVVVYYKSCFLKPVRGGRTSFLRRAEHFQRKGLSRHVLR